MIDRDGAEKSKWLLALCGVGVCCCFLLYGVVQEQIYSLRSDDGEKMSSTLFLLLTQTISNSVAAKIGMQLQKLNVLPICVKRWFDSASNSERGTGEDKRDINYKNIAITACMSVLAMSASNESLRYVSYPTQSLAKSCKLVPIMIMGLLVEKRSYTLKQYIGVSLITMGIIAFNLCEVQNKTNQADTLYGMFLLLLSLAMDGLVGAYQGMLTTNDSNHLHFRKPTALETMYLMNVFSSLYVLPVAMVSGQIRTGLDFLWKSPQMWRLLALFNGAAAAGQFFIFLTITQFSPLICATITTSRKFITILLSVFSFGHVLTLAQWSAILIVFTGLFIELGAKRQATQSLLK